MTHKVILEREPAVVGTAAAGLTLSTFTTLGDGTPYSIDVEVRSAGVRARLTMVSNARDDFDDLVRFFAAMARDWRGWRGARDYESLEHDVRIHATNDGHVALLIDLRSWVGEWAVTASVVLAPGEELSAAARDVAHFLRRQ